MKCKNCNVIGCPNRGSNAEFSKPCTIINQDSFDWQSFQAEAAKDILCAMIRRHDYCIEDVVDGIDKAVCVADSLISKLKEKEEK